MNGGVEQITPGPSTADAYPFTHLLTGDSDVAVDLPCERCQYNLRTLHFTADCPECGAAVASSVQHAVVGPHAWLEKLSLGATLLTTSLSLASLCAVVAAVSALTSSPALDFFAMLTTCVLLPSAVLAVFGALCLTRRPPFRERPLSLRRLVRALLLINVVSVPLALSARSTDFAACVIVAVVGVLASAATFGAYLRTVLRYAGRGRLALCAICCGVGPIVLVGAAGVLATQVARWAGALLCGAGLAWLLATTIVAWRSSVTLLRAERWSRPPA